MPPSIKSKDKDAKNPAKDIRTWFSGAKPSTTPKSTQDSSTASQSKPPLPTPSPTLPKAKAADENNEPIVKKPSNNLKRKKAIVISDDEGSEDDTKPPPPKKHTIAPFIAAKAAKLAGPSAPGSKNIPDGAPDALAGLCFVFTGELSAFSRDEAIELAKRFGGRVVGQPSSKTDYVVVGEGAGQSKLAALKKHNIKTLNEDAFLNLIATRKGLGKGKVDEKTKKKQEKEEKEIKAAAAEIAKREAKAKKEASSNDTPLSSQLWTTRYAPQNLKEICGNKSQVEKLHQWLVDWPMSFKCGFKKPGKYLMNIHRAVLITGPPGIGKTTSAHLCAKAAGYTPIELNASDVRSKKLIENGMNINNTSLDGFLKGEGCTNSLGIKITDRTCLIMDEVDGMSAGDRGGVGAMNALIKKTKIPIICIANDGGAQKLKPLQSTAFDMKFQKPQPNHIKARIMTIAYKEKLQIPGNVVEQLITGAQSDIRQVLNMLSTYKLSKDTMNFDEGKSLVQMNEKYTIMSPFDITLKILGPSLFAGNSRETLSDKMDLYFQDHSFMPMFIQENYLKTTPSRLRNLDGPERDLKMLELMDKAASSISDGDLVDGMIHGTEQHWSLMPLHAVTSTVRPASYQYGGGFGWGGPNRIGFPQWFGQNSKQGKLSRQLGDIQIRMRLKVSGDKSEIRQSYIPALFPYIVKPLMEKGTDAVDDIIERMDDYFISKEDWEALIELGVGENQGGIIVKKIAAAAKSSLTRKYNAKEHPIPFHRAEDLGKAPKQIAASGVPDVEDAWELDDVADDVSDDEKGSGEQSDDLLNDKLIKAPKKKGAATTGDKGKGKGKAKS